MGERPTYEELKQKVRELEQLKPEITEGRNVLHGENRLFAAVFEGCRDAVFLSDQDAAFVLVNDAASELTGYSKEELLQMSIPDLHAPEDRQVFRKFFQSIINGKPVLSEVHIRRKNGEKIPAELNNRAISIDGKTYMHTVARDITDRKQFEQLLKESEKRFRALSNAAFESIFLSEDCVCLDQNLAAVKMFGYENQEAVGRHGTEWIAPEDRALVRKYMEKGYDEPYEVTALRKDGTRFLCEIQASMMTYQGRTIRITALRDISERVKAESALRDSNYKFEAVLNKLDSGVYIADMDSYEILFMNNYMKEAFGKDMTGMVCWQYFHEDQTGPCKFCTNDKLVDSDGNPAEPYIWEFYNQKMSKWYECHDQAIPWTDGRLVRMEIAIDITEQKKMKNHLEDLVEERTAELEDTNTALKVLLNKREKDQEEMEDKILANYQSLIEPLLYRLKKTAGKNQHDLLDILESNLSDMLSPFSQKLTDPLIQLTPKEVQIASFIKQDYSNKEIAETFNCSVRTIDAHRNNIRKKLDIKNKKVNLKTYLMTL